MKFNLDSLLQKQSWLYLTFGLTLALSSSVIIGWLANISSMVQIDSNSVPMQFNTALCLFGISVAGITLYKGFNRYTVIVSAVTFLIPLLTLVQYAFDVNLHIDELIITHNITTHTSSPGRMAPNSALCFLLSSMCLIWLAMKSTRSGSITIISGIISLIFVLSMLSILGYVFSIETSYGWGNMTYMSLQTALGFLFFCIGLLLLIVFHRQANNGSIYYVPIIMGTIFLMVTLLFTNELNNNKNQTQDPILLLKRDLVNDDINLKWSNELLRLATNVQSIIQSKNINIEPYQLPQSFVAMYVENLEGSTSLVYQHPEAEVFTYKPVEHTFYPALNNPTASTFGIETTDLFVINDRHSLLIKLQPANSLIGLKQNIASIVVRVDIDQFLHNTVTPILSQKDQIIFTSNQSKTPVTANQTPIRLPFYTDNSHISIQYGSNAFSDSQNRIVYMVFFFGLFITFALVVTTFFGQRSVYQNRRLLKQASAKEAQEAEIQQSNLFLKLASDVAKLGIWRWNIETGELTWNDRMYEIYETPVEVIKNGLLFDYWYQTVSEEDRDRASATLQEAVDTNQPWEEEFRLDLPGGKIKYIKATAICFTDHSTQSVLVFGGNLDVTQEKLLQLELEAKTQQAEMDSLAKSQFLANMSHELRTPMNGVLGIGELLAGTNLNAKQHQYLDTMMSSADKLLSLLNDILDLSKIEAGEMHLETICVPFEEVVADSLKSLATSAHQKGLDYHYQKSQDVPEWVYTDPVRLGQIIINIVGNAIKFTEAGEITVNISIDNATPSKHDAVMVTFEISDTGIGLSSEELKTVFAPFTQADQSITRRYGGTGLGLSIVQQLINMLEGSIEVESELGKGTCVRFSIPMKLGSRKEGDAQANPDHDYFLQNSSDALDAVNCLVVDGNDINRKWLEEMLHSWHCNVTLCADGAEGLKVWEKSLNSGRMFDALIVDNNIKGLDAFEFIRGIHKQSAEHKVERPATVFVMTSKNLQANITTCAELNIKQHILKPVKQSEVFNALMTALGKKQELHIDAKIISEIDIRQQLKVLVAEDHPVNQMLVKDILDNRGHKVSIVENGRLALEALETEQYDAILMDVQMPVMDGITATQLIRQGKNQSDICIIGLTAKALKEDKTICLEAGMNYYLTKPIKPSILLEVLENREIRVSQQAIIDTATTQQIYSQSEFPEYQVLNIERSMLTTGEDLGLLRKLLQLTNENITPTLTQIKNLEGQQNWPMLGTAVHKGKGMLANFCDPDFTEIMEQLIDEAEQANDDAIAPLVAEVIQKIEKFSEELTDFMTKSA